MTQLSLFDSEEFNAIAVPETILETWKNYRIKMPFSEFISKFVEQIKLWESRNPQKDFFEMWCDNPIGVESAKYLKSIYK